MITKVVSIRPLATPRPSKAIASAPPPPPPAPSLATKATDSRPKDKSSLMRKASGASDASAKSPRGRVELGCLQEGAIPRPALRSSIPRLAGGRSAMRGAGDGRGNECGMQRRRPAESTPLCVHRAVSGRDGHPMDSAFVATGPCRMLQGPREGAKRPPAGSGAAVGVGRERRAWKSRLQIRAEVASRSLRRTWAARAASRPEGLSGAVPGASQSVLLSPVSQDGKKYLVRLRKS